MKRLFQKYNSFLVILYVVVLFPIAFFHMMLLGIFGSSKKSEVEKEIDNSQEVAIQNQDSKKVENKTTENEEV